MEGKRATAFVPGHVTAFFSAHSADDPTVAGSRGAGATLTDGVTVGVSPAVDGDDEGADGTTTLDGDPAAIGAVDDVLAALGLVAGGDPVPVDGVEEVGGAREGGDDDLVPVDVAVESDLPIGAGFGVSGAAALGAALAANAAFDRGRSENELVRLAHAAEVGRGTGLGDVVAQARGGVPVRLEPGAPGVGALDGVPATARVEYVTFGELSTEAVLGGDTAALSAAGEDALGRLRDDPRLPTMMAAARRFAREAELLVPEVETALDAVDDAGGEAAMAMLGRTVFALGTGLSDAGYDPASCRIDAGGGRLVDRSPPR